MIEGLILLNTIMKELTNQGDYYTIDYCGIVDKPYGKRRETEAPWEEEYARQSTGCCEDDYYGDLYIPVGDGMHYFHFFYRA